MSQIYRYSDSVRIQVEAGKTVELNPGQSICLTPSIFNL